MQKLILIIFIVSKKNIIIKVLGGEIYSIKVKVKKWRAGSLLSIWEAIYVPCNVNID